MAWGEDDQTHAAVKLLPLSAKTDSACICESVYVPTVIASGMLFHRVRTRQPDRLLGERRLLPRLTVFSVAVPHRPNPESLRHPPRPGAACSGPRRLHQLGEVNGKCLMNTSRLAAVTSMIGFLVFAAVYLTGWVCNSATHDLALGWTGMKTAAFLAATAVSTTTNFIGQKWLVFRGPGPASPPSKTG